jgi:hypothetical protein
MKRTSLAVRPGTAIALAFAFAFVVGAIGVGLIASTPAVAQDSTTELANSTVSVDSSTQSVYAEVNASGISGSNVTVDVTWFGIENGTETQDHQQTGQTVSAGQTTLFEHSPNVSAYDSYRVVVTAQTSDTNATANVGKIEKVSAGGGGLPGGNVAGIPIAGIAVVVVGYLYIKE